MSMNEGVARFLDLEERANHLATELEKLRDEIETFDNINTSELLANARDISTQTVDYTEAANGIDVAITKLEPILATLTELVDKSQNALKKIKRKQEGGLITRLFGGRHG